MAETYWERKLWEPDIETMPRKELRELQKKKLFRQLIYAYENAPFYHELYNKEKVDVYKIRTIEDFQKLVPTVDKDMLRAYRERTGDIFGGNRCLPLTARNFAGEFFSVGKILHSTGTTGMPTYYIFTKDDLDTSGNIHARAFWRQGLRPGDFVWWGIGGIEGQNWHLEVVNHENAFRKINVCLYSWNMLNPAPDFDVAMRLEAQGIHVRWIYTTIPGFRWLVQKMEQESKNLKRDYFPELKCVFQTGELSKSLLDYGCELCGIPLSTYSAVTETMLTGCSDCVYDWKEGDGGRIWQHIPEDTHFIEIFPPSSDKAVDGAKFGEMVITNLFSKGMAYIRFRAEDYAQVRYDPCPYCGFTHIQGRIKSRVSESANVKGKTITMGDIEDILYTHPELRPLPAQLVREEPQPQDKLRLRVSYKTEMVKEPEQFRLKLVDEFKKKLGVDTEIALISPEEVRAIAHKFERVIKEKRQS
jgi:phenylacetate-CoA ligase